MTGTRSTPPVRRWLYAASFQEFARQPDELALGALVAASPGDVSLEQKNAWQEQLRVLRTLPASLPHARESRIYFKYTIPRLGRRADVLLAIGPLLVVLEFKVGERTYPQAAVDQVWDYALDLKNFHEPSQLLPILPILVATAAPSRIAAFRLEAHGDGLFRPVCANETDLPPLLEQALRQVSARPFDVDDWEAGRYRPTPTIIEAARALYLGHSVEAISRSDAGAQNLTVSSRAVEEVIQYARSKRKKCICFVTGVPGAGKTLVGLDVANRHSDATSASYSVFLSGNGPLVKVLQEALTRDKVGQARARGERITKSAARTGVEAFIQNVHHFRDDCLVDPKPPIEHVVLFDEAQRAWTEEQTTKFMAQKKGRPDFGQSEPSFLLSCLDRHDDWAVVVCLVGGGQEINTGEAGIREWFDALLGSFPDWEVHVSPRLTESEYRCAESLSRVLERTTTRANASLHLATSMRSFRAETLSQFVREVLELDEDVARASLRDLRGRYPLVLTRDLDEAKTWLRRQARGSERYGILVSSSAERLKPLAIDVRVPIDPVRWFLDDKEDPRSSYYLEEVATEFVVQGLELDWACVVWDGDLRHSPEGWRHHEFRGRSWNRVNKAERQRYLENAYRVLLTRARQGMVVVVPKGNPSDPTRAPEFYDATYRYLKSLGVEELGALRGK